MTPHETLRRSWAIGELMLRHPELTRAQVEHAVDRAIDALEKSRNNTGRRCALCGGVQISNAALAATLMAAFAAAILAVAGLLGSL
jgi:hypothetical protein